MMGLSDAAWRVILLLAATVAPWGVPVEAIGARTMLVACVRLAIVLAVYAAAAWGMRRATPKYPGVAALAMLTMLAAPAVSAFCSGERGPLARGVWFLSPFLWATLAAIAAGPLAAAVAPRMGAEADRRLRLVAGAVVIALGLGSLVVARPRLSPRDALWRNALAIDPGNADAALAVADESKRAHLRNDGLAVLLACAHRHPDSCACAEGAASEGIDMGHYLDARHILDASDTCPRSARRIALGAEALIGTNALDEGEREAERAIEHDANDPHAVYARAWGISLRGRSLDARADAERAVALGRGIPAELLLGSILYGASDLNGADAQFQRVLAEDPACIQATYDRALVADRQRRYHDAREGYLRTLQLDPKNSDARYNLVLLTQSHGAMMEAKHHLEVFRESYPGDPRFAQLAAVVAAPSPVRAMTIP